LAGEILEIATVPDQSSFVAGVTSPVAGAKEMKMSVVRQRGALFLDEEGRQMTLRGVNLGGDCKVPYPSGGTYLPSDFGDHREVSFVGRPFPLTEADEHFRRLKHWGFNALRLLTTWEAVEHAGPGRYDESYLEYFAQVCRIAGEYGLYVFIDFHQDVWSRMTGGDGAPGWTLEAVGLDFRKFAAAGAAHVMQAVYDYDNPEERQPAYPPMSWGSNYYLPANGIMWSLFWAGELLTPDFRIDGRNVQAFLQAHYLGAMDQVARRVARLPNVLGFDTLNEPGTGWIGIPLTYRHLGPTKENPTWARVGPALSPLDSLAISRGIPTRAAHLSRNSRSGLAEPGGERVINPNGVDVWRDGGPDPFERAGAWRREGGRALALDDGFFRYAGGRRLDLSEDGFGPLFRKVGEMIRRHNPDWSVFAELDPFGQAAGRSFPQALPERSVNASHWYDVQTLFFRKFSLSRKNGAGADAVRASFVHQLGKIRDCARNFPGGAPTLIGEFGIPFDLDDGKAFAAWARGDRDGVWDDHNLALELMYDAMDELQLHSTQWNYTVSNRNSARIGDGWNQEDLSIYSQDQVDGSFGPDSGGRAMEGFCRPYARRVQGRIVAARFDRGRRHFTLDYQADPTIGAPTEIHAPRIQFPAGVAVRLEGVGARVTIDAERQTVEIAALAAGRVQVIIEAAGPAPSNGDWVERVSDVEAK